MDIAFRDFVETLDIVFRVRTKREAAKKRCNVNAKRFWTFDISTPEKQMNMKTAIGLVALVGSTAPATAQTAGIGHGMAEGHEAHMSGSMAVVAGASLTEPGQGAFASLSEVVRVLEADPDTDWSRVDLGSLRAHLVDMNRLVLDTVVTETILPDGISAVATGDTATLAALRRMVPAHALQLASDARWKVEVLDTETGVELRVTSDEPETAMRIKGLGFFGLMASQDHHREHHMMIARGETPSGH